MLTKKTVAWSSAILLASLSFGACANILIENHTEYYGTAKTDITPCSSISSSGVLKPYSHLEVPDAIIKSFCSIIDCTVNIYMSADCSGSRVGVVKINSRQGIISAHNVANSKVRLSGHGSYAAIDPA